MRLVIDSSALVDTLLQDDDGAVTRLLEHNRNEIHAPAHLDAECLHALRRKRACGQLDDPEFVTKVGELADAPVTRHELPPLLVPAARWMDIVTGYDALFVALADRLSAPLVTTDRRLARAVRTSIPHIELALPVQ